MKRRGFLGALAAAFAAPITIAKTICAPKPKTTHYRFDHSEQRVVYKDGVLYVRSPANGWIDHDMDDGRIDLNKHDSVNIEFDAYFGGDVGRPKPYTVPFVLLKKGQ